MSESPIVGTIILAAGNSSRLGEPKQLLLYNGKTLIRNVSEAAIQASDIAVVVTGSVQDKILKQLSDLSIHYVNNPNWENGMGTSIAAGMNSIIALQPALDAVIVTVSDQPFISPSVLEKLITRHKSDKRKIIACTYAGSIGTPVFFPKEYFAELLAFSGQEGAKKLVFRNMPNVLTIPFELGEIDIDTWEDYENLTKRH